MNARRPITNHSINGTGYRTNRSKNGKNLSWQKFFNEAIQYKSLAEGHISF
jgi:hypothetical protein